MKTRNGISNKVQNNNTITPSNNKSTVIPHFRNSIYKQLLEKKNSQKNKYREQFRKLVKQYLLFFEFSIMKTAIKTMKRNKWRKFYRKIKFLSLRKVSWRILCSDLLFTYRMQLFQSERKKLTLRMIYLSFYVRKRKLKYITSYHNYLMSKFLNKWKNYVNNKKNYNNMINDIIDDCANNYFLDISIKAAIKIQEWFRNIRFYTKLDNIYDIEKSTISNQNEMDIQYQFGSFNLLVKNKSENIIMPLCFLNHSSLSENEVYEKDIKKISKTAIKETSKTLLFNDLLSYNNANHQKICKKLLQYKFEEPDENEDQEMEEKSTKKQPKEIISRSKKNQVINSQLKPIRMRIGCSFKYVKSVEDIIQSLLNFNITPEVKSPNDVLIIERTETFEVPKDPKYIFYQQRYRSPMPGYENNTKYFNKRPRIQNQKEKKQNIKKQIFYTPKKINPNKITQYNRDKNEKGINAMVCTLGEYMISNLNINIPLRFSDLLTEENLNIHDFEISYDPVMKQGIDNEIEIVFQNVTFMPHLSFRKFIDDNFENSTYFLKYFRYVPYHLSKHQIRKLTELVEPLLYSITFSNLSTILSADYLNCPVMTTTRNNKRYPENFSFFNRITNNQKYLTFNDNRSIKHRNRHKHHHHHHYDLNSYYNFDQNNNYNDESNQLTESEISSNSISDIENNSSILATSSYLNFDENAKVFFCDESQISSDANEFLINEYQSLKFKKKRKQQTI